MGTAARSRTLMTRHLAMAENNKAHSMERGARLTILVLFFLSGACGLIYEGVWM
jgi:hypothetical protein